MDLLQGKTTGCILDRAIEVHRHLGPGLLESVYRRCLASELATAGLRVAVEVPIPIRYKAVQFDAGFRADLVVDNAVIVELKAVERLLPIHECQLLTYLKLAGIRVGLLINFNALPLKRGFRRLVR